MVTLVQVRRDSWKCPCCAGVFMLRALVRLRAHGGDGF